MRRLVAVALSTLVSAAALVGAVTLEAEAAEPLQVYVATNGNVANDGLSPARAVPSVDDAELVIKREQPDRDVEIRIAPGTYVDDGIWWNTLVPGHTISFMPTGYQVGGSLPSTGRPRFVSPEGDGGYWFWAQLPSGHPGGTTGLRFYYLDVRNYATGGLAIVGTVKDINDRRVPVGDGMNGNTVYGMRFEGNGTRHNNVGTGYGGLVLHNSSNNTVQNNHFIRLENNPGTLSVIHGVYYAHGSNNNLTSRNAFRYITGDPVNVRNDSNNNRFERNVFERTGQQTDYYYVDWSCGAKCVEEQDHAWECPSHGNRFAYNQLRGSYNGGWIKVFFRYPGNDPSYIGPGCSNDGRYWLTTSGNVRH